MRLTWTGGTLSATPPTRSCSSTECAPRSYHALEEAGLPIPRPRRLLDAALGARAREGSTVPCQVIAAMEAGTVLGSSILYVLAGRGGRGVVERYGPFIGIGPAQLDRAERQIQGHGALAVVLGRRLPGLRVLTSVGCGIYRAVSRVPAGYEPGQHHLYRWLHHAGAT
jgi:membrane protein DedA with SNARE-associated domain